MMTCKTYVFKLSSGQLDEAGAVDRLWAAQHRLMCRRCKAFTANQAILTQVMTAYRDQALQAEPPKDST